MSAPIPHLVSLPFQAQRNAAFRGMLALGLCWTVAQAQPVVTQGIYTCVDAKGRKLTADRPIPECVDREQKILNPSGSLKERVAPALTARERAEQEARRKAEQEEIARLSEERRRDRALVIRYPNKVVHDKERADALGLVAAVRQAAVIRVDELVRQQARLDSELEFYAKDPSRVPAPLKHQADKLSQSLAVQHRFIADQDAEYKRVNARFDEELTRLKQLWAPTPRPER